MAIYYRENDDLDHGYLLSRLFYDPANERMERIARREGMNWIPMSKQMPPNDDSEIFIRKLDCSEWQQTPANEIWMDVSLETSHEWEWAYWRTIKNETHTK